MVRKFATFFGATALLSSVFALAPSLSASSLVAAPSVNWHQATTGGVPGGPGGSMAYDPATHQLILLQGNTNSTWSWSGTAWTQLDSAGCDVQAWGCTNGPNENTMELVFDPQSQQLVMFGGDGNQTWAWNGTSWRQVADAGDPGCTGSCTNSPHSTPGSQMAYDPATKQMVMFGGANNDIYANLNYTWVLSYVNGTYSWSQVDDSGDAGCTTACTSSPPARNVGQMIWDPATNQLVLWGGEVTAGNADGTNATWIWTGTIWQQVDDGNGTHAGCGATLPTANPCPMSPPGRVGFGMAFDPAIGEVIVFGGMNHFGASEYNDTWAWNGSYWHQIDNAGNVACGNIMGGTACTGSPSARDTISMALDPATNQIVMNGGGGQNDTWTAAAVPAVPSMPRHVKVIFDGDRATLRWNIPAFDGGGPLTGYRATVTHQIKTCAPSKVDWCNKAATIVHGQRYTIHVWALNAYGKSQVATLSGTRNS